MRRFVALIVLTGTLAGCQAMQSHSPLGQPDPCMSGLGLCPPQCETTYVKAPPPKVEICAPEPLTVKIPRQKIVVEQPEPKPAGGPPAAPAGAPAAAPAAAPMGMMAAMTIQPSAPNFSLPSIALDWVSIPIPVPRIYSIPYAPTIPVAPSMGMAAMPMAYPPQCPPTHNPALQAEAERLSQRIKALEDECRRLEEAKRTPSK